MLMQLSTSRLADPELLLFVLYKVINIYIYYINITKICNE